MLSLENFLGLIRLLFVHLYLISYICGKQYNERHMVLRELYFTNEFVEFYNELSEKVKMKSDYTMDIERVGL